MLKKILSLFVFGTIIFACNLPVDNPQNCSTVENHLNTMCHANPVQNSYCCRVVAPTKQNKSFTQVCQELIAQNIFVNTKCLSTIVVCEQIDSCTNSR